MLADAGADVELEDSAGNTPWLVAVASPGEPCALVSLLPETYYPKPYY